MRVCIDPGHGGEDPGTLGAAPERLVEKDFNLAMGLLLEEAVREVDWEPLLIRRQDRTLSLAGRAAFANRYEADVFVSLHANAAATPVAEGFEVFHFPGSGKGRSMAFHVLDRLLFHFPAHLSRGIKDANFAVLRLTTMPAILVELEFLSNPRQLDFLADPENQKQMAAAIVEGLVSAVEGPFQTTIAKMQL